MSELEQAALTTAVKEGNLEAVGTLIESFGPSYSLELSDGYNLLCDALAHDRLEIAKLLLQKGAKPNRKGQNPSNTPLHLAVESGDIEIVKMLLHRGADITAKNLNGRTALHTAVNFMKLEIIKLLLDSGSEVNAVDETGGTSLHIMLVDRFSKYPDNVAGEIARMLLSKGADVNLRNKRGQMPIFVAVTEGYPSVVEALLEHKSDDVNFINPDRKYLLHLAAKVSHLEVVKVLLKFGADVDAMDRKGMTPLHNVSSGFHDEDDIKAEIAKLLVSKGANVNATSNQSGITPLHYAVSNRFIQVVKALLDCDANVNSVDTWGRTPLRVSYNSGSLEIFKLLVQSGADIDAKDREGNALLHVAAREGREQHVIALLEGGCDVNIKGKENHMALNYAAEVGSLEIVNILLRSKADVNSRDLNGGTALHIAAWKGHSDIVKALLEHGADVNIMYKDRFSPLHLAIDFNRIEVVTIFERHIVKIFVVGFTVTRNVLLALGNPPQVQAFLRECKAERKELKRPISENVKFSVFQVLKKSTNILAIYARNDEIVQALEPEECQRKFPIYCSMINSKFKKAVERKELLDKCNYFLISLAPGFPKLPHVCTEKILTYLSDEDLKIFLPN